jgi:hypothetical protein
VLVPLKLEKDQATRDCLENARRIKNAGYEFQSAICYYDGVKGNYETVVWFTRGSEPMVKWIFRGFSAGYSGEGPRGLIEFCQIFGLPVKAEMVLSHDQMTESGLLDGNGFNLSKLF